MKKKISEVIILLSKMNELYPNIILLQVADSTISSIVKFINVLFLGIEINLLFSKKNNTLQIVTISILFLILIISLSMISKILDNYSEKQSRLINLRAQTNMSKHLVDVNYETFEREEFKSLFTDVKTGLEFVGGFQSFVKNAVSNFVDFLTTLILSGGVLTTVLLMPGKMTWAENCSFIMCVAILVIIPLVVSYLCGKSFGKIMRQFFAFNIQFNKALNYYFEYAFKNIAIKRLLWLFDPTHRWFNNAKSEVLKDVENDKKLQVRAVSVSSVSTIVINGIIGIFYILLGMIVLKKNLGVGTIVTSVGTLELLIYNLSSLFKALSNSKASLKIIQQYFTFMNTGSESDRKGVIPKFDKKNFKIVFHNVSYHYPNRKENAIENINLTIKSGEKLALVGKNGSGKTTIVKLLLRLIKPSSGYITINGIKIEEFDINEYRRLFSSVPQDTFVFADTICNNVALGSNVDRKKVIKSLENLELNKKVLSLKYGIDTPLTNELNKDGINLSGGERQEIGIGRAIYKNSLIYVMDEPTAALDPIKEAKIYSHMSKIVNGQTALFISHRMSLTNQSDYIYVLDDSHIVEEGTHKELMNNQKLYYKLYKTQQEYFKKMA